VEALQNFLVLIQNVFGEEPGKIAFLGPRVKYIGARISAGNVGLSETRNASDEHARVNDGPRLAPSSSRRQQLSPGHVSLYAQRFLPRGRSL
jgi:hypothetical protein